MAISDGLLVRTLLSTLVVLVMLAGCASTQEPEDRQALTFLQVKAAPDSFKGQKAVFGGKVLTARRQKDSTKIEILQLPLDQSGRPGYDLTQSEGRFIAQQREFLDPATLPPGTRIVVTGIVSGSITLPLDETDYTYPVIDIKRVQVWAGPEDVARRTNPYYMGPGPYWGGYRPLFSPYSKAKKSNDTLYISGPCTLIRHPPTIRLPCEASMPFSLRPYRRFPMRCSVTYNAGPFQGQGTAWNLSMNGWRLSGDLLMRPGETLSLTVTLPNEQHILIPVAVVRWSRGQEFAVENLAIEPHTRARLQHYVNRLVRNQRRISWE